MIEVLFTMMMMYALSNDKDRTRTLSALEQQIGLSSPSRWTFYVVFTRSWSEDVQYIASGHIQTDLKPWLNLTKASADEILMRDPGIPLIRRVVRQMKHELEQELIGFTDEETRRWRQQDWRIQQRAQFSFLEGWAGDVDELGGDMYHLAARITLDAPTPIPADPMAWFHACMAQLYEGGEDRRTLVNGGYGEYDIVGMSIESSAWTGLSPEEIQTIESRELLNQPIERNSHSSKEEWELYHRMVYDDIDAFSNGKEAEPSEMIPSSEVESIMKTQR